jgi:hypothetical protein
LAQTLKLTALTIVIAVVVLFATDQLLGLLGFASDTPFRSSHRESHTKTRKNIEFEFDFATNEYGLRYAPIEIEKLPGEVRVLLLGDSFTEGVGIDADDTFGMYLENLYGGRSGEEVRFVNAGLGGQGPLEFWRVFRDVGLKLNPDALLLCIYANDLADTPEFLARQDLYRLYPRREGVDRLLHKVVPRIYIIVNEAIRIFERELRKARGFVGTVEALADEQGVSKEAFKRWSTALPPELIEASDNGEFNKSLLSVGLFNPDYWIEALEITTPGAEQKFRSFTTVLDEIVTVAREHEMAIGVVYIPSPLQYDPSRHADWNPWIIGGAQVDSDWLTDETELQKRLASWTSDKGIPFFDLAPALREEIRAGGILNYKLDGHWNTDGHRTAGKAIGEWLDAESVFGGLPGSPP